MGKSKVEGVKAEGWESAGELDSSSRGTRDLVSKGIL